MIKTVIPTTVVQSMLGVPTMMHSWNRIYSKKYWPYQYEIKIEDVLEAERWCWQRFKGSNWNNTYQQFVFKRSRDAVMFALRWS